MFRDVVWERLICVAGVVAALVGNLALLELDRADGRYSFSGFAVNVFAFARAAGAVMAILGGIGWYLAVRDSAAHQ